MGKTTFQGDLRFMQALKHLTRAALTGAETEIEIVSSTGAVKATANTLLTEAGAGITAGTGTLYNSSVMEAGGIIRTTILVDLTGLSSSAAADIIGVNAAASCHFGAIPTAQCGTIQTGLMTCLEAPATGEPDIDLYSAVESTGTEDTAITDLDETALLNAAADWTLGLQKGFAAIPADGEYLYLVGSGGGTSAVYTAGMFLIELFGYRA